MCQQKNGDHRRTSFFECSRSSHFCEKCAGQSSGLHLSDGSCVRATDARFLTDRISIICADDMVSRYAGSADWISKIPLSMPETSLVVAYMDHGGFFSCHPVSLHTAAIMRRIPTAGLKVSAVHGFVYEIDRTPATPTLDAARAVARQWASEVLEPALRGL